MSRTEPPNTAPLPAIGALAISVVVPVLDEEKRIADRLRELTAIDAVTEVIVVDGGSNDQTCTIARSFDRVRVIEGERGRAKQMNQGANLASGDVLWFVHADVGLPPDAGPAIREALQQPYVIAGAFRTWTTDDQAPAWLKPFLHLADLRSRYTSLPYGDQALFVRASAFRAAGGFPELPLMEDVELSRRLRRLGRIRTLRACVRVSGRRFVARPIYYLLIVNLFPLLFCLGVPTARLARWYGDPR